MEYNSPSQSLATTLSPVRVSAVIWQTALVALAIALPSLAHLSGLPVRQLLPMHWPVILAGLVYGWRGGLIVGLVSPGLSFLVSSMPYPPMIAPMTIELACYGAVAGLCREQFKLSGFASTAIALIAGRIAFLAFVFSAGSVSQSFVPYLQAAMVPGLIAAAIQIVALPFIARWWVGASRS